MHLNLDENMYLYCAQSEAPRDPQVPEGQSGAVDVCAGLLVPAAALEQLSAGFDAIASRYPDATGALHIGELPPSARETLHAEVHAAIQAAGLAGVWYAVHPEGFHAYYTKFLGASDREDRDKLRVELFAGLCTRLDALLNERAGEVAITGVRSGQALAHLHGQFQEVVGALLEGKDAYDLGLYDEDDEEEYDPSHPGATPPAPAVEEAPTTGITLQFMPDGDGLSLAAAVLADSLGHLFNHRPLETRYGPLNRREAIADHPLVRNLDVSSALAEDNVMGDGLYAHPLAKATKTRH